MEKVLPKKTYILLSKNLKSNQLILNNFSLLIHNKFIMWLNKTLFDFLPWSFWYNLWHLNQILLTQNSSSCNNLWKVFKDFLIKFSVEVVGWYCSCTSFLLLYFALQRKLPVLSENLKMCSIKVYNCLPEIFVLSIFDFRFLLWINCKIEKDVCFMTLKYMWIKAFYFEKYIANTNLKVRRLLPQTLKWNRRYFCVLYI